MLFCAFIGGLYLGAGFDPVCAWLGLLTGLRETSGSGNFPESSASSGSLAYPSHKRIKQEPDTSPSTSTGLFSPEKSLVSTNSSITHNYYCGGGASHVPTLTTTFQSRHNQVLSFKGPSHSTPSSSKFNVTTDVNQISPPSCSIQAYLPFLNEKTAQQRMHVHYLCRFSGPFHAGKWIVECQGEVNSYCYLGFLHLSHVLY